MFEWDRNNLRKIRAHTIEPGEVEESLTNDPLLIYEQNVEGEIRFLYYGKPAGSINSGCCDRTQEQIAGCDRL